MRKSRLAIRVLKCTRKRIYGDSHTRIEQSMEGGEITGANIKLGERKRRDHDPAIYTDLHASI